MTWTGWGKVEITDTRFSQVLRPQQYFGKTDRKEYPFYREKNTKKKRRTKRGKENRSLATSLSLRFSLLKLLSWKRQKKNQLTFSCNSHKRIRLSRISGIIVRLANEKLTYSGIYSYSGISQTNAHLVTGCASTVIRRQRNRLFTVPYFSVRS